MKSTGFFAHIKKTLQTTINSTLSAVLLIASLGSAAPLLATQRAFADSLTVCASSCTYDSIQAAVDGANAGDTIDIQAGTYNLTTPVSVAKNLTITGEAGVLITADNIASAFLLTAPGTTVQNLSFGSFSKMTNNGYIGVSSSATNTTIKGNTFNAFYRFGDGQVTRGVVVSPGTQNLTISNNYFNTLRQPAYIDNNVTGTISNNYTEGTKGWVVGADSHLAFTGNTWGTSTSADGNEKNAVDIAIIANASSVDQYADILTLSAANHNAAIDNQYEGYQTDAYVDATGAFVDTATVNGNGYWTSPFRTIQAGVNRVVAGGRVHVAAGNYAENVTISKTAKLTGANVGVNPNTAARGSESVVDGTLTIKADNVRIDGFAVQPTTGDSISADFNNPHTGEVIKNNIIWANGYGVHLNDSNSSVSNNQIVYKSTGGIGIETSNQSVSNFIVSNNVFTGSAASSPADVTIIGNATPISENITVSGNTSTSGTTLVALFNVKTAQITGNTTSNVDGSAVYIGGNNSAVTVSNNTITGATTAVNVADDFGDGANSDVTAHGNNFSGSTNGVKVGATAYTSGDTVNATGNYWGDASGPTDTNATDGSIPATNPYGSGVKALGAVNYADWCTAVDCSTTVSNPLPAPTNLTPADGTYTNDPAFTDTWSAVNGAVGYEYQTSHSGATSGGSLQNVIYSDSTTSQPGRYSLSGGTISRQNGGTPEGDYYWQVRAVGTDGSTSPWSVVNKVTVDTTKPSAVQNTAPSDNATLNTHDFTFTWTTSNDNSPVTYTWEASYGSAVNADGSFQSLLVRHAGLTQPQVSSPGTPDGTYYWHVKAVDAATNETSWSATWNVTVDTQAPNAPTNLSLKNSSNQAITNGFTNSYSVTASWNSVSDANHYVYKVWDNINGDPYNGEANAYTTDVAGTSRTGEFTQGEGTYTIEIASVDAAGNQSAWSTPLAVTYDKTAPVTAITSPAAGSTVSGTVTISGSVTDVNPDHYYLVIKNAQGTVIDGPGTVNAATVANYDWNTTNVADGTYTIDLEARDKADNKDATSVKTVTVTVNNTVAGTGGTGSTGGSGTSTGSTGTNSGSSSSPTVLAATTLVPQNFGTTTPTQRTTTGANNAAGTTTTTTPQILGTSTGNASSAVKGASTVKKIADASTKKSNDFLGLGWWWLPLVAIAGYLFFLLARRRSNNA